MSAKDLQTSHLAAALMSGTVYNANAESLISSAGFNEQTKSEKLPDAQKDPSEEDKEEASGEEFTDEESETQTGSKCMPGRGVTLQMLLEEKMLEPGIAAMTIEYLGQKFVGDLQTDGKIKSHETETIFCSPSAWAIHCKRIINPDKRSGCGWASVKYRGKKLDTIKATYLRKKQIQRENMHSDEETDMMEVESPPEPPPQRVVMKHNTVPNRMMQHDANLLIEAVSFSSAGKVQPFLVSVSSNANLILDIHCHLKKEEVYGYLAGTWDLNTHNLMITHTFPCLISKNDKKPRVMVELEIQMEIEKLGLVLLGWYHSHPTNPAMPSLRDCDNQLEYQIKMRGPTEVSYVPCIGVVCSPYNPESPVLESSLTFFWVMPPPEQRPTEYPRPLMLQYNLVNDSHLTHHTMEQIRKSIKYYCSFPDENCINFKDTFKPDISYLDKLKCTLTAKFPREQSDGLLWHFIKEELGCSSENDDKMDLDALLAVPQPIPVSKPTPPTSVPNFPSVSTLQQMVSRPAGVPPINVSSSIGSGSPHKFEAPQLNIPVLPTSTKSSSKSTTPTLPPSYPTGLDMLTSMALGLGSANMSMPLGASSLESLAAANNMLNSLAPGLPPSLTASLTGGKLPDPPSYAASLQNLTNSLGSFEKTPSSTSTSSSSTPIPASIASNLMMSSADIANALFSATKYSNAGILGIPDPMSKSTLAANNMFLSPSLLKMQESLMKPLSSSSPISAKAGLDQSALMKSPHELLKSSKEYSKDYSKEYKEFSKEYSKDYSKETKKDYGRDFSKEHAKDYGKDYSKDYGKDFSKEQSKDYGKDYSKDFGLDFSKDYSKDYKKDASKNYGKDFSKDYGKDYGKEYAKDASKDYAKDFSKDYGKDYSKEYAKDPSKDYVKDYSKEYAKDPNKDYGKDYSKEYAKDPSKDYAKDFSKEYSKDYSKEYAKDSSKDYGKDFTKDYAKDYKKDAPKDYNTSKDYGIDYSKDYGKDFSKDYTKDNKDQNKDYGKDFSKDYGKDYNKDYAKEYGNRDYNKEFKDYTKEYKDYLPPDFGSVVKGKPDSTVEPIKLSDPGVSSKTELSKPEPMDTQATDFSMLPRVGGESFLNQMLELTKKTTMPDYMGDYNPPPKLAKVEELAVPMPSSSHPYLGSASAVDSIAQMGMGPMGTFIKPDEHLDFVKEQDYSIPAAKPSESDK